MVRTYLKASGLLVLGLLSVMACSSGQTEACPQYQVADGVTVDASAFFAAHATAYELCVNQTRCVARRPGVSDIGTDVLAGGMSALTLRISILTSRSTKLIDETAQVKLHHVAFGAACVKTAMRSSVIVTARGALSVG